MSGGAAVIIIGGGRTMASDPEAIPAGGKIQNLGSTTAEVTHVDAYNYTTDIFINAGQTYTFTVAGTVTVQP